MTRNGRRGRGRDSSPDSDPDRQGDSRGRKQLGAGFVLLVGLSGGMMALQGGATIATVGLATLGSLLAGGALLWYLYWIVS